MLLLDGLQLGQIVDLKDSNNFLIGNFEQKSELFILVNAKRKQKRL